jgi:hypothetical protein
MNPNGWIYSMVDVVSRRKFFVHLMNAFNFPSVHSSLSLSLFSIHHKLDSTFTFISSTKTLGKFNSRDTTYFNIRERSEGKFFHFNFLPGGSFFCTRWKPINRSHNGVFHAKIVENIKRNEEKKGWKKDIRRGILKWSFFPEVKFYVSSLETHFNFTKKK